MQVKEISVFTKEIEYSFDSTDCDLYIQFFDNYFVISERKDGEKTNFLYPLANVLSVEYK